MGKAELVPTFRLWSDGGTVARRFSIGTGAGRSPFSM
jgi:hypothetical protein